MQILYELNFLSITIRIVLALVIGGILGIERGRKRHPAGFRTYMLVCLGAAMVMMTNQFIVTMYGGADPARLGAQVISGIGFLGAGTIIVTRRNQVKGLTTAAGLWSAACIGLAIGIGFYEGAILGGLVILAIMTILQKFDYWVTANNKYIHLYASFETIDYFHKFVEIAARKEFIIQDIEISKSTLPEEAGIFTVFVLKSKRKFSHSDMIQKFMDIEGIQHMEEI